MDPLGPAGPRTQANRSAATHPPSNAQQLRHTASERCHRRHTGRAVTNRDFVVVGHSLPLRYNSICSQRIDNEAPNWLWNGESPDRTGISVGRDGPPFQRIWPLALYRHQPTHSCWGNIFSSEHISMAPATENRLDSGTHDPENNAGRRGDHDIVVRARAAARGTFPIGLLGGGTEPCVAVAMVRGEAPRGRVGAPLSPALGWVKGGSFFWLAHNSDGQPDRTTAAPRAFPIRGHAPVLARHPSEERQAAQTGRKAINRVRIAAARSPGPAGGIQGESQC